MCLASSGIPSDQCGAGGLMRAHSSAGNTGEGKAASQKTVRQELINGLLLLGGWKDLKSRLHQLLSPSRDDPVLAALTAFLKIASC